jgi:ribosomal protein S7
MKQHINIAVDTTSNVHTLLKKYSSIRHSLFNYWSLLFYNKYLYYFFNCFLQNGKKQLAIKLVYFLLYILKKKTMVSPILVLQSALLNYRHILKLKIIKYKRKKIFSYLLLSLNKQVKISIKYLAKQFSSFNTHTNKYSLVDRLSIFILNLFFRTPLIFGRFLQHSAQVHKLIQDNKKIFKRTKFKKYKRRRRRNKFGFRWRWKRRLKIKKGTNRKKKISLKKNFNAAKRIKLKGIKPFNKKFKKKGIMRNKRILQLRKQKQIMKRKKKSNLKIVKRRIRKVLVRSFTRPLKRKRYQVKKYKLTEFTSTVKQLYLDTNKQIDFDVLNDIQTTNHFFINSIPKVSVRKFFFYIVFSKWYKLLERTYYYLTMPFWHLYNLRTRLLRHRLYSQPIVKQVAPQLQNSYVKYLIKYSSNLPAIKTKFNNLGSTFKYNIDPFLLSYYMKIYRKKNKFLLDNLATTNLIKNDNKQLHSNTSSDTKVVKYNTIHQFLKRKSIRTFLKKKQIRIRKFQVKIRLLKLIRSLFMQRILKIQRRRYTSFINILMRMKRYFFILIKFRLIRLVWCALRAVSLRRAKPLHKTIRKIIATRAFLIKN